MTILCILMLIDLALVMWSLSKLDKKMDSVVVALKAQDKFNKSCTAVHDELYDLMEQRGKDG